MEAIWRKFNTCNGAASGPEVWRPGQRVAGKSYYHLHLVPANPRVSILIPVYNEAEYLPALIARLLAVPLWEEVPIEIVAVDDGSTDGSAQTLDELAGCTQT